MSASEIIGSDISPPSGTGVGYMARSALWSVLAHVATASAVFATSILIGRAIGPESLGRYSFFLWVLRLLPTLLAFGVPAAVTRKVAEYEGSGQLDVAHGIFGAVMRLHLLLIPIPAVALGVAVWSREQHLALALALAGGLAVGLFALDFEAFLSGLRRFPALSVVAIVTAAAQIGLTVVGMALDFSWEGYLLAYVVAATVGLVAYALTARSSLAQLPPGRFEPDHRRDFFAYARVVAVVVVIDAFVWGRPELWFLDQFSNDRELGFYSAALRLASLPAVLPLVAGRVLLPQFSWMRAYGRDEEVAQVFPRLAMLLMVITAPIAVGGVLFAGPLVDLAFGAGFEGAYFATAVLFGGSVVNAMAPVVSAATLTGPRPKFLAEAGVVALCVNAILAALLIPRYGANGAAIATTAVQLMLIPVAGWYTSRKLGLPYPFAGAGVVLGLGGIGAGVALIAYQVLGGVVGLAVGAVVGGSVYLTTVLALRVVTVGEARSLIGRRSEST